MAHYVDGFVVPAPNKNLAAYQRLASMMDPKAMPFDGRRVFWGGFKTIVEP